MARQLENNFRDKLCKDLKEKHAEKLWHQKFHGGFYQAGLPDTAIVFEKLTSWVEFKADTCRNFEQDQLTKLQRYTLRGIHLAGGLCGIWHWIHDEKRVQVFSYDAFIRDAYREESKFYTRDELIEDAESLRKALWR